MTFTSIFNNLNFEDIKKYSDLISDVNTYFAYRHMALLKNDMAVHAEMHTKYVEAEMKLTEHLTDVYKKYAKT